MELFIVEEKEWGAGEPNRLAAALGEAMAKM